MIREMTLEECIKVDAPQCGFNTTEMIQHLFNFNYCMPEEYKDIFQFKFFLRYRYQPINYETFAMFRNYLQSALEELLPRYINLYESQNLILNPFINYAVRMDAFTRNQARNKNYSVDTGNNSSHSSNVNGQGVVNTSIANTTGNESSVTSADSVESNKSTADKNIKSNRYYTDSPQKQQPESKDTRFNNGFITDFTHSTDRQGDIASGVTSGYNKGASESAHDNVQTSRGLSESVAEGEAKAYGQFYKDGYEVAAAKNTVKNMLEESGIKGVTVSAVLLEWRRTFINVDKMLLDEMQFLFMRCW